MALSPDGLGAIDWCLSEAFGSTVKPEAEG
jgi:hypothetical protein